MKSYILIALFIESLVFCVYAQTPPQWMNDPYSECSQVRELCAVGEATGLMSAELAARSSMARIFESQVSSTTQSQMEANSSGVESSSSETFAQKLKVSTDYLLRGAYLKKSYTSDESVFALLALDKKTLANDLKEQMKAIDETNLEAYKLKRRSMLSLIEASLEQRAQYHRTYQFLTDSKYPAAFDEAMLLRWREDLRKKNTAVLVKFDQNVDPALKHLFLTQLMSQEYRVVDRDVRPYQWVLNVGTTTSKLHLNVKGFERYEFSLEVSAINDDGQKVGHLQVKNTQNGRSLKQAFENAVPYFKDMLVEDFNKLNMNE